MWTIPHNVTVGEVVLTTYMGVVLFLERPALLSAPRPQTSPSSCTALQLQKQRKGMKVAYDTDSCQLCKEQIGLVCTTTHQRLSHPTATAVVNNGMLLWLTVSFLFHPLAHPYTLALVLTGVGAVPELIIGFSH